MSNSVTPGVDSETPMNERRPYFPIDQFSLDRDFRRNPLMAAIKLARYKFPAKMLSPQDRVLDLGCGNGLGSMFFASHAREVVGMDLFADIERVSAEMQAPNLRFVQGDILDPPAELGEDVFDAIASIDVIEHFYADDGERIVARYADRLSDRGMMILGTPNRLSSQYRSEQSREAHFHEYEPDELRALCDKHFKRTLMFSMNDEVVHTGFSKMSWFFYVLCFK